MKGYFSRDLIPDNSKVFKWHQILKPYMLYDNYQETKVRQELFHNFNSLISKNEFKASERQIQKKIIANFIAELTARELKKSFDNHLSRPLNSSINKHLIEAFKHV